MSVEAYRVLIDRTGQGCHYLWGPIRNALLMEFLEGNEDLISALCLQAPLDREHKMPAARKDMLIQVLTVAGQEHQAQVNSFLAKMIDHRSGRMRLSEPRSYVEAKKVVAQVASNLQMMDILKHLSQDANEDVRKVAVRSAFYLWPTNRALGIRLLEELGDSKAISRWLIPSRHLLQSCFELSLFAFFEDFSDRETTTLLRTTWAQILVKILWQPMSGDGDNTRHPRRDGGIRRILPLIRSLALSTVLSAAFQLAKSSEVDPTNVYSVKDLEHFFRSPSDVKERIRRLVPYVHPGKGSLSDIRADLTVVTKSRDILSCYILLFILTARIAVQTDETIAMIRELFNEAIDVEPGLPSIPIMILALSSACDGKSAAELDARILQLLKDCIVRYQGRHSSLCQGQSGIEFTYSGLTNCPHYLYRKYGKVDPTLLKIFVDNAQSGGKPNRQKIRNYIDNVTVPSHPRYRDIGAILEGLEPILEITLEDDGLQEYLIKALAKIRVYAPHKVDRFMDIHESLAQVKEAVRNKSTEEDMAVVLIGRVVFFVRDAILLQPDSPLAQFFLGWFGRAPDCESLSEWISLLIELALNAICSDKLFELGKSL